MIAVRALVFALLVTVPAAAAAQTAVAPDADPRVQALVGGSVGDPPETLATTLVGFGTRESMSTTTSPRAASARRGSGSSTS